MKGISNGWNRLGASMHSADDNSTVISDGSGWRLSVGGPSCCPSFYPKQALTRAIYWPTSCSLHQKDSGPLKQVEPSDLLLDPARIWICSAACRDLPDLPHSQMISDDFCLHDCRWKTVSMEQAFSHNK